MTVPRTGAEIREAYLAFFEARGHTRLPSDLLVPANDPTLLFTGAGMNQFKDEFMGRGVRGLKRATTSQKCMRVPDLENVGRTPRHHTFFEMLGNFSFGDYFKAEVIPWEWEFFTEVLGLPADRFLVTVYRDDDEAFGIWAEAVGLPPERIYRFGEHENFWPASAPSKGPNGPCGPCSEVFYDLDPSAGPLPRNDELEELPERFLEVGNCVFTQFDRQDDGSLPPLPQQNIDVGLGLERIVAVMQGASNNFETDLFAPTLAAIQSLCGRKYGTDSEDDSRMRRIADHFRAVAFCIADGAVPGREGRGYVVRKILRRAVRDGIELGLERPFLQSLLIPLQESMASTYGELREHASTIETMIAAEEEQFRGVYEKGIARLDEHLSAIAHSRGAEFPGELAFELHDTYGFPVDITEVVVRDHDLSFDHAGYEAAMEAQRGRARAGSSMKGDVFAESVANRLMAMGLAPTAFSGYEETTLAGAQVLAILLDGEPVGESPSPVGHQAGDLQIVLDRTPFYAESGGQAGDRGELVGTAGSLAIEDTVLEGDYILHRASGGAVQVGDTVEAHVSAEYRAGVAAHHTATHLLHAALREVLGEQVHQSGSAVESDRLRFDYTQAERPPEDSLQRVESLVREQIDRGVEVTTRETSLQAAREAGATALFGEKYGEQVRMVTIQGFSLELCGGTHCRSTGEVGRFRLESDRALAAGVRRITALAGASAEREDAADAAMVECLSKRLAVEPLAVFAQAQALLKHAKAVRKGRAKGEVPPAADPTELAPRETIRAVTSLFKTGREQLPERVDALLKQVADGASVEQSPVPAPGEVAASLRSAQRTAGSLAWAPLRLDGVDASPLRDLADALRPLKDLPPILLLAGGNENQIPFLLICDPSRGAPPAGQLAKAFGGAVQGGGGGRPDFAQGKGANPAGWEAGLAAVEDLITAL